MTEVVHVFEQSFDCQIVIEPVATAEIKPIAIAELSKRPAEIGQPSCRAETDVRAGAVKGIARAGAARAEYEQYRGKQQRINGSFRHQHFPSFRVPRLKGRRGSNCL